VQTFTLVPEPLTNAVLITLESLGLVQRLRPSETMVANPTVDMVETIYESSPEFGTHKLIAVRKNVIDIALTFHGAHEEVIFSKPEELSYKPLYLIIANLQVEVFNQKLSDRTLGSQDFHAYEVMYNDPSTMVFTILKDVPHCEVTIPGDGEAPVFYVTEPSNMTMTYVDMPTISLTLG